MNSPKPSLNISVNPTMDSKLQYRIAFASIRGMNVTLAGEIIRLVGSEREFFQASETRLRYLTQSKSRIYDDEYRAKILAEAANEVSFIKKNSIRPVYFTDPDYPTRLLQCNDAPILMYAIGDLDLNAARIVGIVGTRHATIYGIEFTKKLIEDLARKVDNLIIVSGLAYGIDITAHRAAVASNTPTVAVMATGLNTVYPADHRADASEIVRRGGLLLTEHRNGEPIHKGNFVARNRIVAGLIDCLVVVESAERGGALITAELASEYNRDVFALPGRISDSYSAGCNKLIASQLAGLIQNADDLCRAMRWPVNGQTLNESPTLPIELNPEESIIVNFLDKNEDASLQQLTIETGFPISKLMSILIDMEFRGIILALPGGRYRKTAN